MFLNALISQHLCWFRKNISNDADLRADSKILLILPPLFVKNTKNSVVRYNIINICLLKNKLILNEHNTDSRKPIHHNVTTDHDATMQNQKKLPPRRCIIRTKFDLKWHGKKFSPRRVLNNFYRFKLKSTNWFLRTLYNFSIKYFRCVRAWLQKVVKVVWDQFGWWLVFAGCSWDHYWVLKYRFLDKIWD